MGILKKLTDEYFGKTIREEDDFDLVEIHSDLEIDLKLEHRYKSGTFYSSKGYFFAEEESGYFIEKIDTDKKKGLAIITTDEVLLIEELKNDKYIGGLFNIWDEDDTIDDIYDKFHAILMDINKGNRWTVGKYEESYSKIEIDKQNIPDKITKYINTCLKMHLIKK